MPLTMPHLCVCRLPGCDGACSRPMMDLSACTRLGDGRYRCDTCGGDWPGCGCVEVGPEPSDDARSEGRP